MMDEWVRSAMADDTVVADLLTRLKHQSLATPPAEALVLPPMSWGRRLPRSKPVVRCAAALGRKEPARGSPTTPLSWSGGTTASPSATADGGSEETSRPEFRSSAARSKGLGATNKSANGTPGRRSKKKKTFSELKDDESMLLKERIFLRKEIAALRVTVKEHRAANERLKKMKVDLVSSQSTKQGATSCTEAVEPRPIPAHQTEAPHPSSSVQTHGSSEPSDPCKAHEIDETRDRFVLPDLNMSAPAEDDCRIEATMS